MIEKEKLQAYWKENQKLTAILLLIWFLVSYGAAFIATTLNNITIFGFPLGYYMGAQGSLAIFVVLIFYYAHRMNKLDEKYDVAEEEE
jgi:putative solute:sodium symporter small subunit